MLLIYYYYIICDFHFTILECDNDEFTCDDGECIPDSQECDGREDCRDRSDEHANCGM